MHSAPLENTVLAPVTHFAEALKAMVSEPPGVISALVNPTLPARVAGLKIAPLDIFTCTLTGNVTSLLILYVPGVKSTARVVAAMELTIQLRAGASSVALSPTAPNHRGVMVQALAKKGLPERSWENI